MFPCFSQPWLLNSVKYYEYKIVLEIFYHVLLSKMLYVWESEIKNEDSTSHEEC